MNSLAAIFLCISLFAGSFSIDHGTILKEVSWASSPNGMHQSLWMICSHVTTDENYTNSGDNSDLRITVTDEEGHLNLNESVETVKDSSDIKTNVLNNRTTKDICSTLIETMEKDYSSERFSTFILHISSLIMSLISLSFGKQRKFHKALVSCALSTILGFMSLIVGVLTFSEFISAAHSLGSEGVTWGGGAFMSLAACLMSCMSSWLWKSTCQGVKAKEYAMIH